jgi:hypothetical protein
MNGITIILTATVNVNLKKMVNQIDRNERLQVYLKSVLQWLQKTAFNIVLVENSGYEFRELDCHKLLYSNRFEIIVFNERELPESTNLQYMDSKGASEMFAIHYAYNHSNLAKKSLYIVKVTGRYFIPGLEEYLRYVDLNIFDCLTQNNRYRCEMVGCHYKRFDYIFNPILVNHKNEYKGHVEDVWKYRTTMCNNVLVCKSFPIEKTQRGGFHLFFTDI